MPAITVLAIHAAAPLVRAAMALGARAERGFKALVRHVRNRRDAVRLASLDERMLADIGLTRSDLRDAYAEPMWRDPTGVLARRAAERRNRRRSLRQAVPNTSPSRSLPLFPSRPAECYPPIDRPCHTLV